MERKGVRRLKVWLLLVVGAAVVAAFAATWWWSPESRFDRRAPLASCGRVVLGQFEQVPDSAWQCLDDARATGAELVVTTPTTEGDPMLAYYRVGPGIDGFEVYHDSTADTFGDGAWSYQSCPDSAGLSTCAAS